MRGQPRPTFGARSDCERAIVVSAEERSVVIYSFEPIFDGESKILILGSMASVKSLEYGFFYMHPHNRFWKVIAELTGERVPDDKEGKIALLLRHHIALMDSIKCCNREGSSLDSAITDVVPNDIARVAAQSKIEKMFCNGRKSYDVARKAFPALHFEYLPSTSPANAAKWDIAPWLELKKYID